MRKTIPEIQASRQSTTICWPNLLLTFVSQPVLNKLDDFSVFSLLKPDIISFYNPQNHVLLVSNWRFLKSAGSSSSSFRLMSACAVSGQIVSWSLNSIQNAKQLSCFRKKRTFLGCLFLTCDVICNAAGKFTKTLRSLGVAWTVLRNSLVFFKKTSFHNVVLFGP